MLPDFEHPPGELRDAFWQAFNLSLATLAAADYDQFRSRYNNQAPYRTRNSRPWTDLVTRHSDSVLGHALERLTKDGYLPANGERSSERFMDLLYFTGNWWAGTRQALLAVEVENDWKELRGTLRDLLQFQARTKVAVFYYLASERIQTEVVEAMKSVAASFLNAGYAEAASTAYLLIIAPDEWPAMAAPDFPVCSAFSFTGISDLDRGIWIRTSLPLVRRDS